MDNLNKYSKKIILYLDTCISDISNNISLIDIDNNDFINKIKDIVKNNKLPDRKINTAIHKLKKIHSNDEYPLIYVLFDYIINNNINIDGLTKTDFSFNKFVKWYRDNQQNIDNKSLLEKVLESNNEELINIYSMVFNIEGPRKILHDMLYNNGFVSLDIQHHAETCNITLTNYIIEDGPTINTYFIDGSEQPDMVIIFNICNIMHTIAQAYNAKIKHHPTVTLFNGQQKKLVTTYDTKLCAENINSGSTYQGYNVSIWRGEEIYKVLIHELIHFYGIDFYINDTNYNKIEEYIEKEFCLEGIDRPNESYTETLALIIHTIIMSGISGIDFNKLINYEIMFNIYQVTKILKYFGFNKMEELYDKEKCYHKINQRTSVISYFIVKTSLLMNLDLFLNFVSINNLLITDKILQYLELIKKTIKDTKYINCVNEIMKYNDNSNNFVHNTLRMSCIQI